MNGEPADITGASVRNEKKYTAHDLANSPTFHAYVRKFLVPKVAWKFHTDPDDLEQDFWARVLEPCRAFRLIDKPKAWAKTTLENLCRNQYRDTKRERQATERLELPEGRVREIAAPEPATACDDTTDCSEAAKLTREQKDKICRRVLSMIETVLPDARLVVHLRLMLIHADVVARVAKKSTATIYRLEKKNKPTWKQIVNDLGLEAQLLENPLAETAVMKLVAIVLRDNWRARHHIQH